MLRRRLLKQASPLAGSTLILDRMNKRVPSFMGPRLSASMSSYFGSSSANSPISRGPPPRSMRTGPSDVPGRRNVEKSDVVQKVLGSGDAVGPSSHGEFHREDLVNAKRIIIKVGTSVLTRENEFGVSLTRLASLVEQVCLLVDRGHEVIIVTSGAVGFGKMRLQIQTIMSQTVRTTLSKSSQMRLDSRACAATGQSGLMTLYDSMFSQYGVSIAQILVTMSDFQVEKHRANMCQTITELLALGIVPVCNENDIFYSNTSNKEFMMQHQDGVSIATFNPNFGGKQDDGDEFEGEKKVVRLTANDSLSALLAVQLDAQLMVTLTNVDGVFTSSPDSFSKDGDSPKLLHSFNPDDPSLESLEYAMDKRVGRGGMAAKVDAARFALDHGVPSVICNGHDPEILSKIIQGKPVGTFFTRAHQQSSAPFVRAQTSREAGRMLSSVQPSQRKRILEMIKDSIKAKEGMILEANRRDCAAAERHYNQEGWNSQKENTLSLLNLTQTKLQSIVAGIEHLTQNIAGTAVGNNLKWCKVSEGLYLEQESVPLGVVLCIFEARPQVLPEVAALCIASGNAAIFKGSKFNKHTLEIFHQIITDSLRAARIPEEACMMLNTRADVLELLALEDQIDVVIPRGSKQLVDAIKSNTKIPVLGDADGVCHVYIHSDADLEMAIDIVADSKVDNRGVGSAMGALLVHAKLWEGDAVDRLIQPLLDSGVVVYCGPRAHAMYKHRTAGMPPCKNMHQEYRFAACVVEVVDDVKGAVEHIREYGSGHTEVIVTEDQQAATTFLREVDSSCVFHNASSRFSDGYSFGLGAEVGHSNKGHMRGPMGIEGLLSNKWILRGKGHALRDFQSRGGQEASLQFVHEKKCVTCGLQIRE